MVSEPVRSSTASAIAWSARQLCVMIVIVRRSTRSATAPAQAPSTSIGPNWSALRMPIEVVLPVSRSTMIATAVNCTHVPTLDAIKPRKNSFAFRLLRTDRNVPDISVILLQGADEDVAGDLDPTD